MRLSETHRLDLRAIESVTETLKKSFDVEGFEKSAAVPYVFGDGYRRVPPYYHTYATNCKERWRGRTLLDVFSKEFRDRDELYYVRVEHDGSTNLQRTAINTGLVNINNKAANIDTLLNNGDVIRHRIHRHEPPVNPKAIEVLHESVDGLVVIDKPAGIPPEDIISGYILTYNADQSNCVVEIMRLENKLSVNPCNRLDRLTSGVMFMAKNSASAGKFGKQMFDRTLVKEYLAKVLVECEEPVITVEPKLGLNRVKKDGKPAKTLFRRLSTNGQTSIVHCTPVTGRTHQIRVHLQYLGHPIVNDPIYANTRVFGTSLGKGGMGDDKTVVENLDRIGKTETSDAIAWRDKIQNHLEAKDLVRAEKMNGEFCVLCQTPLYYDPSQLELGIYLHCFRTAASDGSWSYQSKIPDWASAS